RTLGGAPSMNRRSRLRRTIGIALAAAATLALAPPAALTSVARGEDDVYNGGALTGLAFDSGYTFGSFQDVSYLYPGCGTDPAEQTCVWQVHVQLSSDPSRRCVPTTPKSTAIWDSGPVSGNGEVHSGPRQFALEGCPGQYLSGWYEMTKTYDPEK